MSYTRLRSRGSCSFFFQAEDGIRDLIVTGVQTCVFFQEEDGIRDLIVTGVQTCALPISAALPRELAFDSCRVPAGNLLGVRGRGYAQFLQILDEGRVAIAALATGLAAGCVAECLRYVAERAAFGHHLGYYQAIQFKLADMEARVHAARLCWHDAAARL